MSWMTGHGREMLKRINRPAKTSLSSQCFPADLPEHLKRGGGGRKKGEAGGLSTGFFNTPSFFNIHMSLTTVLLCYGSTMLHADTIAWGSLWVWPPHPRPSLDVDRAQESREASELQGFLAFPAALLSTWGHCPNAPCEGPLPKKPEVNNVHVLSLQRCGTKRRSSEATVTSSSCPLSPDSGQHGGKCTHQLILPLQQHYKLEITSPYRKQRFTKG